MTDWLFDTFLYTGLLIAAVLLVRRPVARHFGPSIAYSLWLLPLLRFVMPPIVLPAWMAPAPEAAVAPAGEPLLLIADQVPAEPVAATVTPLDVASAAPGWDWAALVVPLWLVGAALFLAWRTWSYREMRRELLADARPVGEVGTVRLVETPAVSAPVAFGVRDKVVALPLLFMAHPDREGRDLAIAHELAHHRGHDLLANIAAQPLLALHWFNPIAWLGWRAMRRDQEAACDARVMDGRNRDERATYAHVIASFAQGDRLALAAPMACPILGEKSIIHRLRSLSMSDIPSSRRWLGRSLMAAGAFALPLTASISYAAAEEPVRSIESVNLPPSAYAPDADVETNVAQERIVKVIRTSDGEGPDVDVDHDLDIDVDVDTLDAETRAEIRREMADARREMAQARREVAEARREVDREIRRDAQVRRENGMSEQEIRRIQVRAMADAERAIALAESQIPNEAEIERIVQVALTSVPQVVESCRANQREPVQTEVLANGSTRIFVCERAIEAQVLTSLRSARAAVAADPSIEPVERVEALRELDQEIAELQQEV